MKILHVAVFTPESTNVWQADAFEELGCEVIRYDYRQRARDLDGGIHSINPNRDAELIEVCKRELPDLVLFSKCNKLHINVVKECNKVCKTALWYMDPRGNIDGELIEKMKYCHYVFTSRWDAVRVAEKYNRNVYRIHEGYDPKVNKPFNIPKIRNVCFIGNLRSYRYAYYKEIKFDVVSNAFREEHAKIVSETKINLNFTEGDGTSDRTYKVLAAKGFLLTMPWENMEEDFEVGEDLDIFTSPKNLKEQIEYYLIYDEERERIAEHGYNTVKKYDNINYARSILSVIGT